MFSALCLLYLVGHLSCFTWSCYGAYEKLWNPVKQKMLPRAFSDITWLTLVVNWYWIGFVFTSIHIFDSHGSMGLPYVFLLLSIESIISNYRYDVAGRLPTVCSCSGCHCPMQMALFMLYTNESLKRHMLIASLCTLAPSRALLFSPFWAGFSHGQKEPCLLSLVVSLCFPTGTDSCQWLLSTGRFLGKNVWQPYGCMMHKYSSMWGS